MCGISGSVPAVEDQVISQSLALIAHRGPDGEGIWNKDNQVSLGHRRLAISDLSENGIQPMHRGPLSLVFNGEIYNYPEIKKELEKKGHTFRTTGDAEVILVAWQEWGAACLSKFNGMWAFALWDEQVNKLFLARDRFGKKPLFWTLQKNIFAFSSEMKGLFPFMNTLEVNTEFKWMKENPFAYEATDKCLINDIHRFPAASWGEWDGKDLKIHRWWNTLEHIHSVPVRYETQVEEFRELFLDSINLRMRSRVPIGTALSGGVDSSAVFCGMAEVARKSGKKNAFPEWKNAFVASLPGTPLDETLWAKKVTDFLHLPLEIININAEKALENLQSDIFQAEEIYQTPPSVMAETYRTMRNSGVIVTLDGHGADELFSGYDTFLFNVFKDTGFNLPAIFRILDTYRNLSPVNVSQFRRDKTGLFNYFIKVSGHPEWKFFRPFLFNEIVKAVKGPKLPLKNSEKAGIPEDLGGFNADLFHLFHRDNLPTLLRNYDRYSMGSGVEIRMPFLDHRIVSYAFSIPWTSKIRGGFTKAILRDAVMAFAPHQVIQRKWKMGFQAPIVNWIQGPWKTWLMDELESKAFNESQLIDSAMVKKQLEKIIQSENPTYREGELAWNDLSPWLWEKYFLKTGQSIVGKK